MIAALRRIADSLGAVSDVVGRYAAWLCLGVVFMLFLQVPLREIWHGGNNTANDIGQVIHASLFMIGISYAMRHDGHVRVDIFYSRLSVRARAAIDLGGTILLLLPWLALVAWYSIPIVVNSVAELEAFAETYTPGYFILKLQLFSFVVLVGLQAMSNIARAIAVLASPALRGSD
jgi:TRAP-type mannitol/chloroaromatic compound transport system permease small subunit